MNTSNTATSNWTDFNDADSQQSGFDPIPRGATVPVRMTLKPGGYDDASQGWSGGYATQSFETGSIFLACEFVVTDGPYARRKLWSNIGLHSAKGPTWGQMGRAFIRAILNSARGVHPEDNSPPAVAARRINGFADLDGVEFIARVDVEKDAKGQDRNVVKAAVQPDHKDYAAWRPALSNRTVAAGFATPATAPTPAASPASTAARPIAGKPAWAQ